VHLAKELAKGPASDLVAECEFGGYSTKRKHFAECHLVHSAKASSPLPVAVMAIFLCRVPYDTRQSLCRVPDKKYSAK
jgi:hypothetical protein